MKRIALVLATLAILFTGSQVLACGYSYSFGYSAPRYSVTAFALPYSYSVQSYAYAVAPPVAFQALPPVAAPADPCLPQATAVADPAPVVYAQPAPVYSAGVNFYSSRFTYTDRFFRGREHATEHFHSARTGFREGFRDPIPGPGTVTQIDKATVRGPLGRIRSQQSSTTIIGGGLPGSTGDPSILKQTASFERRGILGRSTSRSSTTTIR